jgi:pilus assembly protein CpaE
VAYQVTVVGSPDRQLEELLHSVGMGAAGIAAGDLARFAQPAGHHPDAVVIDLRGQEQLPPSLAAAKRQYPLMGVVIVGSRLDPAVMLEAMRAGVNEWLTEPLTAAELQAAVLRVVTQRPAAAPGKLFAVVGAKGGVGSTTVAVNLATAARQLRSTPVLLIDLHQVYGDAALFLGAEPRFSVVDALENIHRLDEAFFKSLVVPTKAGPDLLASSDRGTPSVSDVRRARLLIDFASRQYRYVVLDVPRSDPALLDALEPATKIILVVNQELATVRSSVRMATVLGQRYGRDKIVPVLTRYDLNGDIGQEDVERVLGPIRHVFPSEYRLALQALNKGRPLILDNHNKLAASIHKFADELTRVEAKSKTADQSQQGFLSRLRGRRA